MNYTFRKCENADMPFIYELKEKCFRWYIEKIYGWNEKIQLEMTLREMDEHLADMNIIRCDNKDIGLFTFSL